MQKISKVKLMVFSRGKNENVENLILATPPLLFSDIIQYTYLKFKFSQGKNNI
jgi:hypothetical protein